MTAAGRPHIHGRERERRKVVHRIAVLVEGQRRNLHLDVRRLAVPIAARERADLRRYCRHRAPAKAEVLDAHADTADAAADHLIERSGVADLEDHPQHQVVLQILAHAGHVMAHRDAVLAQQRARSDARHLQKLRRPDRTARKHDLASRGREARRVVLPEFDAGRALAVETNRLRLRVGDDTQVRPVHHRPKENLRRLLAHAAPRCHVCVADALLIAAIEVRGLRDSAFGRGFNEGIQSPSARADLRCGALRPRRAIVRAIVGSPRGRLK